MPRVAPVQRRKSEHLKINLEQDVRSALTTGLQRYHLVHQALPELDLAQIDTSLNVFGRKLRAPLLISSMTGGTQEAATINQRLAEAAQDAGIALGVGSQRAAIEDSRQAPSFQVRRFAPDILLFANLGAVQLNYGYGVDQCRRAVEMIEADALILHLNPLQEAVQSGGDTDFSGLASRIEEVCRKVGVPVVVKEVGWGISASAAKILGRCGVSAIDVAGAGGTSWSQVEMHRAQDELTRQVAASFVGWGIPTAISIRMVRQAVPEIQVFASGGLRDGIDIAKCVALGATMGGMAGNFLKAAAKSAEDASFAIRLVLQQLQVAMFASGVSNLDALQATELLEF
ncbi:MAG: type 2 isopentenyl-diphosphate Delta-isomerase [Anaerolineales bacterium]